MEEIMQLLSQSDCTLICVAAKKLFRVDDVGRYTCYRGSVALAGRILV